MWRNAYQEVIHHLTPPTEHENGDLRHAGMDCRYPGLQDASGDIHVSLDSSTPCWNDAIEGRLLKVTEVLLPHIFEGASH